MTSTRKLPANILFHLSRNFMEEHILVGTNLPQYFVDFCIKARDLYDLQRNVSDFPSTDPGAVDCRSFHMSLYGILNAESTRTGHLRSFYTALPKLVLPFPEDDQDRCNADAIGVLEEFIKWPKFGSEAYLRSDIWDDIFKALFKKYFIKFRPELALPSIDKRCRGLFLDGFVGIEKKFADGSDSNFPLLMIEVDKHQLELKYDHKDIVKLAISMGAALKKLLGSCRYESQDVLKSLCVYGVLAGGTKFDICVMYPDFGDACESDFGHRKPFPPFHMIFRYSRQFWRFDLFGNETKKYDSNGILEYLFEPRTEEDDRSEIIGATFTHSTRTRRSDYHVDLRFLLDDFESDQLFADKSPAIPTKINFQSIHLLTCLSESIKRQAMMIKGIMESNRYHSTPSDPLEDEKFRYNRDLAQLIPEGRDKFSNDSSSIDEILID